MSQQLMNEIDAELSHVWMVRTFLKHSEEAEEDDEIRDVHRGLYDYMLALGGPLKDDIERVGGFEQTVLVLVEVHAAQAQGPVLL